MIDYKNPLGADDEEGRYYRQIQAGQNARSATMWAQRRDPRSRVNSGDVVRHMAQHPYLGADDTRMLLTLLSTWWTPVGENARALCLSDARILRLLCWTPSRLEEARRYIEHVSDEWKAVHVGGRLWVYTWSTSLVTRVEVHRVCTGEMSISSVSRTATRWVVRYSRLDSTARMVAAYLAAGLAQREDVLTLTDRALADMGVVGREVVDTLVRRGLISARRRDVLERWSVQFTSEFWALIDGYLPYCWSPDRKARPEAQYEDQRCRLVSEKPSADPFDALPPAGFEYLYALFDPREPDAVRYVGRTSQAPSERLRHHLQRPTGLTTRDWIRDLLRAGVVPRMRVLEVVSVHALNVYRCRREGRLTREGEVIEQFMAEGHALLNYCVD